MAGRVDVVRIVAGASWGTGFAIAPDRILTALHVVGKVEGGELRLHGDAIRIAAAVGDGAGRRFPIAVCSRADIGDDFDPELDWAAIRVDADAFPGLALPALGAVAGSDQGADWSTYGFPESSADLGKATGGVISSTGALIRLGSATQTAIQLYSREAGAAQGGAVHGYSGGPVIVGDHVIGLLSAAGAEAGRSVEGTLYAIPLTALAERLGLVLARDRPVAADATAQAQNPAAAAAAGFPAAGTAPGPAMVAGGAGTLNSGPTPGMAAMPATPNGVPLHGTPPAAAGAAGPAAAAAPPAPQIYASPQVLGVAGATAFLGALLGALIAFGVPGWGWGPVGVLGLLSCIGFVRQLAARDPVRGAQRSFARLLVLLGMLAVVIATAGLAAGVAEQFTAAAPLAGALRAALGGPWQLQLGLLAVGVTAAAAALPLLVVPPQAAAEAAQAAAPRAAILEPATGPPLPEVFHERIRLLFEKRAFEAFRLDGYDAAAGCLTGECRDASGSHRAIVRCDDRGAPLSEADAAALASYAAALPGGDRARVYYATPAAAAIDPAIAPAIAARYRSLAFVSEADLLGSLVYFDGYLRRVVELYEKDPLPYSHTAVKKSLADTFVAPRFAFHGATGEPPRGPLRDYLDDWLADQRPRQIALLADYGMGKSSFLKHYAWHLARARLGGGAGRIPILLSLTGKSPRNQPGADGLLQAFINQYQLRCEVAAFHVLMKAGRLVFLIDAFDEMDLVGDRAMRLDHFAELWRLYTPGNKLLFAGRPTFFPDEAELNEAFRIADRGPDRLTGSVYCERLALSPLADDDIERSFDCYFDPATARRHFAWVRGNPRLVDLARRPAMMHIIRDTIDELRSGQADAVALREASLLRIYTDHWIVREEGGKQRKLLVNRDLRARFSENLAVWMFTGSRRAVQTRELGELFAGWFPGEAARVAAGAGTVQTTGAGAAPATAHVQTHLREGIETDLRNCTFLVRDPDGAYSFAHKPFLEYFVAAAIDRGLHERGEVPDALQLAPWGTEVALHVADLWLLRKRGAISTADAKLVMAAISKFTARTLMARLVVGTFGLGRGGKRAGADASWLSLHSPAPPRAASSPWRRATARLLSSVFPLRGMLRPFEAVTEAIQPSLLNAMQVALRAGVQFEWIRHTLFGSTIFHKLAWNLGNIDAGRCLAVLDLAGARFDDAQLQGLDLAGRSLRGASFDKANMTNCRLDRADLTDARLTLAQLADTSLVGATLGRADCGGAVFTACRLDFADAHEAVFNGCVFLAGTSLRFSSLRGASLQAVRVEADLTAADLRGAPFDGERFAWATLSRVKRTGDPVPTAEIASCTLGTPDSLAWAPDDSCLLVRSRGSAWLLDAGDGALIRRFQERAPILAAAFRSPTEVVVLSGAGAIAIYDLAAGVRRETQLEPGTRLIAAAVSGNGTWFATVALDGGVIFGHCADPKTHRASRPGLRLGERDGTVVVEAVFGAVAIDDLGEIVAVLVHGAIEGRRATSKLLVLRTDLQSFDHVELKVSPAARVAVRTGGSAVGVIDGDRVWQYEIRSSARARKRLDVSVTAVPFNAWLPDGSWIDTRDRDWKDGLPAKLVGRWRQGPTGVRVPVHAHRDRALAIAGPDDLVVVDLAGVYRDLPVFDGHHRLSSPRPVIEDLRFVAGGRLATAGLDCIRTWDLVALSEDVALRADPADAPMVLLGDGRAVRGNGVVGAGALEAVHGSAFCAGQQRFAVRLRASDNQNGDISRVFVHERPVARADDHAPGAGSIAGRSWAFDGDGSEIVHGAFSSDDRWLALAGEAVTVVKIGSQLQAAPRISIHATALAFLSDGALALGAADGRLLRFDPETFERREVLRVADAPVSALAAAGRQVAIATGDGTIFTWTPGETTATPLAGPFPAASRLALSPDGQQLAAACDDDIVRVFDLASRSLVARLYHLEAGWAAVRADGKYDYGGDVSRLSIASQMRTYRLADLDEMIPDGRIRRASDGRSASAVDVTRADRTVSYNGQPARAGRSQEEQEVRAGRT